MSDTPATPPPGKSPSDSYTPTHPAASPTGTSPVPQEIMLPTMGGHEKGLGIPTNARCSKEKQHLANLEWSYPDNHAQLTEFVITTKRSGIVVNTKRVSKNERGCQIRVDRAGVYNFEIVALSGTSKSKPAFCSIKFGSWSFMEKKPLVIFSIVLLIAMAIGVTIFLLNRGEAEEDIESLDARLYAEEFARKDEQKSTLTNVYPQIVAPTPGHNTRQPLPPPAAPLPPVEEEHPEVQPAKTIRVQRLTAPIPDAVITKEIKYVTIKSMTSVEILVSEQKFPVLSIPTEFRDALQIWWDGISAPTPDHNGNIYFSKFPDRIILGNRTEEDVTIMIIWTPKHKLRISPK